MQTSICIEWIMIISNLMCEWMNEIWYIHNMEYYLPTKMNGVPKMLQRE